MKGNDRNNPKSSKLSLHHQQIKLIGLGGIGSWLAPPLLQFLSSKRPGCTVWLIDGDDFEEPNRDRVLFAHQGNKALVKAQELSGALTGGVTIVPVPQYVTPRNAPRIICEHDVVFLAVDNHAVRRCVSDCCRKRHDVLLISGGNDGVENGQHETFGNVIVYWRANGRDETHPLTQFHPEIAHAKATESVAAGCAVLVRPAPQLLFTNLAVASAMLNAFYARIVGAGTYEEVFVEILEGRMTPVRRAVREARSGARKVGL